MTARAAGFGLRALLLAALLVPAVAVGGVTPAGAHGEPGDLEQQLADRFAPIIKIKEQEAPCDADGEPYAPIAIDIVLDNPDVVLRQVGEGDPVLKVAPSGRDLFGLSEGFYVDFPGSALDPGCVYEHDFERYSADLGPIVYAHVVQQAGEAERLYLQYWFYWYYNDWNNKHESDWEGIVLEFEASTVAEALGTEPVAVGYAQHEGGERSDWDADKLEREGMRPVVYSSAGSHASYFDSGVYIGRSASEGFGCDDTSGPSTRLDPSVVVLPTTVDDADHPQAWLAFDGRWGERQGGPFNGPTGPASKERWLEPADWFDELRSSSVIIPAGDSGAAPVVGVFCDVVEAGSNLLITFTISPLITVIALVVLIAIVRLVARRTDWSRVAATPVVRRRRAGQILRAAFHTYARSPLAYLLVGLVAVPAAVLTGLLTAFVAWLPGVSSVVVLADDSTATSVAIAAFAGSVANVFAFVLINAVVATYLTQERRGVAAAIDAARAGWSHWRSLLGAYVRSFAIVFVLLWSFVGIPWGIRQIVRYQFVSHAVALDDESGSGALRRSSDLVKGRWFHTAVVTMAVQLFVAGVALLVSLLVLVVATGIPIWFFSALSGLVLMLTLPLAAIAMTLLYGDAVAASSEGDPTDGGEIDAPGPDEPDVALAGV